MSIKPIVFGLATYVPGRHRFAGQKTGGTVSARYCYSVWLRHLVLAQCHGLSTQPHTLAELGPGDSLGIGLAALLCGTEKYYALDVMRYANNERNVHIFDELVELFHARAPIPGPHEASTTRPLLDSYAFPHHILTDQRLAHALDPARLAIIRRELIQAGDTNDAYVTYFVPWYDTGVIDKESVDMILSQAVLEHVSDLEHTYQAMYDWLKPNGYMSHQIDFKSHGLARDWDGHWAYSDLLWKIVQGRRPYLLNRATHSTHRGLLDQLHFAVVCDIASQAAPTISRAHLAPPLRGIPDEDRVIADAFIQAVKMPRQSS